MLASATLPAPRNDWAKPNATLAPSATTDEARLVVLASGTGATGVVSFSRARPSRADQTALRADLARAIADLKLCRTQSRRCHR